MPERILIVDDDPAVCRMCEEALSGEEYQVLTAASGDEAFDLVQQQEFAVVLSDIRMPGMSGIDLLESLRQMDPEQPVIMFSGFGDVDVAVEAMKHGAFDSLAKPLIIEELKLTINNALRHHHLRQENQKLKQELQGTHVAMTNLPKIIPLVQNLSRETAREFLELGHIEAFQTNESILEEGSTDDRLHIVIEGEISVWQEKAELYRLGKGDSYGEIGIFRPHQRSHGLMAELPGQILILEKEAILSFFNQREERLFKVFVFNTLNAIFAKYRKACGRIAHLEQMLKG